MNDHLTDQHLRRMAVSFYLERYAGGPPTRLAGDDKHLLRCDACHERLLAEVALLGAAAGHARRDVAGQLTMVRSSRPRRPAGHRALAAVAAAVAVLLPVAWLSGDAVGPRADAGDALRIARAPSQEPAPPVPQSDARGVTAVAAMLGADRPELRLTRLSSAGYALSRSRVEVPDDGQLRVTPEAFQSSLMPKLDPVDQWRTVQMALARLELYPEDAVDGLYGPKTRHALRSFFQEQRPEAVPPNNGPLVVDGVLAASATRKLLNGFEVVVLE